MIGREADRRRHFHEQVQQRTEVRPGRREVARRRPELGIRVDDRELDLVLGGAQVHEQLVDVVEHFGRSRIAPIDLVQRDDDRQVTGHRLLQDVPRLGQGSFRRIDEQQDRVHHEETALDFTAEIGMTGCVHDVEPRPVVIDGRLLGQDRDALLTLEVARVHHSVHDGLVRPERAGLAEHRVDEGRLAVVDVRDDRDIAQVGADRGRWRRADGGRTRGVGHG